MRSSDSEKILVAVDVKTNCAYDYKCNKKTKKCKCRKNCISKLYLL